MPDKLKDLERRLNSDEDLRNQFARNPGGILRAEGISLTAAQSSQIRAEIAKVKLPRPGTTPARRIRIGIGIKIIVSRDQARAARRRS